MVGNSSALAALFQEFSGLRSLCGCRVLAIRSFDERAEWLARVATPESRWRNSGLLVRIRAGFGSAGDVGYAILLRAVSPSLWRISRRVTLSHS